MRNDTARTLGAFSPIIIEISLNICDFNGPLSMTNNLDLSIIVPLYNEEESVPLLYQKICDAVVPMNLNHEIVFVNDGSKDDTLGVARELTKNDPRLRVIEFRKNYGQTPAMAAGIDEARGDILVTMDGDLQNDPSDIPMMVNTLIEEQYDIVVGWRHQREDKLITRKIPSRIANWIIGKVTGVPIKDNGCSLKVYRAAVMKSLPFYSEMHRFIPALLSLSGARVKQVKVKHHARQFGESKYGLSRVYKVIFDLLMMKSILSILTHPVRFFAKFSLPAFLSALALFGYGLYLQGLGQPAMVSMTISVILFTLGAFIIALGFICELIYEKGDVKIKELAPLTVRMQK